MSIILMLFVMCSTRLIRLEPSKEYIALVLGLT
jgi:hypothetical protein